MRDKSDWFSTITPTFGFKSLSILPKYYTTSIQTQIKTENTKWIPDKDGIFCMCCRNNFFSVFIRKHHCRNCGRIICGKCSRFRDVEGGLKENLEGAFTSYMVRICEECDLALVNSLSLRLK